MAIMAAVQAAGGIAQKISAGAERRKADKFFNKNKYEVPSGVNSMLDIMGNVASQRDLPGGDLIRQRLSATTSQGVETAERVGQSSSDVLGALQGLYSKQMNNQQDMAIASAQNWQRNQLQYANALQTMGQYQTEKWNYNVLYPYMQKMTAAGEMGQAGNENIASGISSGLSVMTANAQMQEDQAKMAEWERLKGLGGGTGSGLSSSALPNYFERTGQNQQQFWNVTKPIQNSKIGASPFSSYPNQPNYLGFNNPFSG